ncbi:hypothetical protein [Listeria phage vB_Lmo_2389_typeII]
MSFKYTRQGFAPCNIKPKRDIGLIHNVYLFRHEY